MNIGILKKGAVLVLAGCLVFVGGKALRAQENSTDFQIGEKFQVEELAMGDKAYVIDYKTADVTGDNIKDEVVLVGEKPFSENDIFADNLTVIVKDGKKNEYVKATYEGLCGYEGELFVGDFTGDKVNDVMVTANTGGSGGIYNHMVATFKDNEPAVIFSEKDNNGVKFTGKYLEDFKAEIIAEDLNKTIIMDLSAHKDNYIEMGIYNDEGKLLTEVEPWSNPFSKLEAVDFNLDGTFELSGVQRIVGTCNADPISFVDSIWSFDNSKWNIKELKYTTYLVKN